jgi:hypothetical protein
MAGLTSALALHSDDGGEIDLRNICNFLYPSRRALFVFAAGFTTFQAAGSGCGLFEVDLYRTA